MEIYQTILMWVCLAGVIAACVWAIFESVIIPCWGKLRAFTGLTRIQQVLLGLVVIGFIQYGATKEHWRITFTGGIKANTLQPSVITNNTIYIHWQRDTSGGVLVPATAPVYIDCRLSTDTNGNWTTLGETTVGAWSWSGTLQNATNYDYNVWAYYIPPEPVHTNGVWVYKTMKDRNEKYPIPLRSRIEINGKAIATPKEKRRDSIND